MNPDPRRSISPAFLSCFPLRRGILVIPGLLALLVLLAPSPTLADDQDEEIHQTVARISYISGSASFNRGDDPDDWQAAYLNVPMTLGDRVYTGEDGRLELQVSGGNPVRIGPRTDLTALNLAEDTKQFSLDSGIASFQIRRLEDDEIFEVDTPNAAVTLERPGEYRLEVDADGNTRVGVRRGSATVAAAGGEVSLHAGEEMDIDGIDSPEYDVVDLAEPDGWDLWIEQRERRLERARSRAYVSPDVVGTEDLDEYGRWTTLPQYGTVWTPTVVDVGWQPYVDGQWIWQDPWGWTWVAGEPWGWAPYHYGRWVFDSSHWYWVPVAPAVRFVAYSPALVAFVGGGPGWSASVSFGNDRFVGWFPLAPADPFIPWWGSPSRVSITKIRNVTYLNHTHVTVINQNTFVNGGFVKTSVVRDRTVIRDAVASPVLTGPIPAVPARGALRIAARAASAPAPRPPAAIATRSVVARIAPPAPPPSFQAKVKVIRENLGRPVAPALAARIAAQEPGAQKGPVPIRSVVEEAGTVKLKPRRQDAQDQPSPQPVRPAKRRSLDTPDRRMPPPSAAEDGSSQASQPARRPSPRGMRRAGPDEQKPAASAPVPSTEPRASEPPHPTRQGEQSRPSKRKRPVPPGDREGGSTLPERHPTEGERERPTASREPTGPVTPGEPARPAPRAYNPADVRGHEDQSDRRGKTEAQDTRKTDKNKKKAQKNRKKEPEDHD